MTKPEDELTGLDAIKDPQIPISDQPDPATIKENKSTAKQAGKPTPTELHDKACKFHINDPQEERTRLIKDIADQRAVMQAEISSLRAELESLRPAHSALTESHKGLLATNIFSTVMLAIGGSLISGAGYLSGDVWKLIVLFFGIATLLWGLALQITATWRGTMLRR